MSKDKFEFELSRLLIHYKQVNDSQLLQFMELYPNVSIQNLSDKLKEMVDGV